LNSRKIGRNEPCPCGSGKKFKKCHGSLSVPRPDEVAATAPVREEIRKRLAALRLEAAARERAHGKGKPIITTEFGEWRFVAVGNELHYSRKDKTRVFPDFLGNYLRGLLGTEWGTAELAKLLEARHQILKWYDSICRYQRTLKPGADGIYRQPGSGAMLCWFRLAYDFYLIKHNAELQKRLLDRVRSKEHFQGARFELCVSASMIVAGFRIDFEDETDNTRRHAEFVAKNQTGLEIAVEAKSRHRVGVLDFKSLAAKVDDKVAVEAILRSALGKLPDLPYFVFVDVNLPFSEIQNPTEKPWFRELAETVENLRKEWEPGTFPANAIFFCNDPNYYSPDEVVDGNTFWCYEIPIADAARPIKDPNITIEIAKAVIQRANIPNEFPND